MLATASQLLWYTTRATGVVALVLLTASVVLGVLTSVRAGTARWPRFAVQDLHKRVSLLSVVFIALHITTAVSDSFAPIGWVSAFVPFTSSYRRLWLGLGTAAFDLLLAVVISSLLRQRIAARLWRTLHWLAYASWPLALVHGLGTGTDPHLEWMVLLTIACVAAVLAAIGWRLVAGWPARAAARLGVGAASFAAVVVLAAWTATGPLRPGWAARAGTPANLLAGSRHSSTNAPAAAPAPTPASSTPSTAPVLPGPPYDTQLTGSISQSAQSNGLERVDINATTQGTLDAVLQVTILGIPDGAGGVVMQQSQASFGSPGHSPQYQGQVAGLEGSRLLIALKSSAGSPLELRLDVAISGTQLSGRLVSVGGDGGAGDVH
jgi:sulfoxide reductase heme-binding subunit YedZ